MVNASRIMARENLHDVELRIDLFPRDSVADLARRLAAGQHGRRGGQALAGLLPPEVAGAIGQWVPAGASDEELARFLKDWRMPVRGVRPLKEAMVTVGGVQLEEIDPASMQSRRCAGLYFAGEVMDVDGPTGGYNLHAAFATARLAIASIAGACGLAAPVGNRGAGQAGGGGRPATGSPARYPGRPSRPPHKRR